MPHFMKEIKNAARSMRRLQKYHMLDEVQEGLIK